MLFTSMYKILWQFALVPSRSLLQINQEPRLTVNHRVQKDTTSDCVEVPANRLAVDRFALAQHVSVCSKTKTHCLSWLNRLDPDQRDRALFEANGANCWRSSSSILWFWFRVWFVQLFTFVRRVILMTVVELNLSEPLVRFEVRWSALWSKSVLVEIRIGRSSYLAIGGYFE